MAKKEKALPVEVPEEEQPYAVPENWRWMYLLNGAAECMDGFRKPINATERADRTGDIPYYGATGQVGWIDDFLTDEQLVLLGEDGAPFLDVMKDKAYLIEGKAWVNNHAHILRSYYGEVGNIYLMHYLNQFNYTGYVNGTTRLKLTQASMMTMPVPIPPLPEQRRIVSRIESLFAKLDEAKEKAQAVVDGFEDRKAAILHKAFTGALTEGWRKSNNASAWEMLTLNDIADYKKGPFGSSITKAMFVPKGPETYKVYEQGNAIRKTLDYGHYYISKSKYNELKGFAVLPGDILISCAGTIGEVYRLPDVCEPGVINQALMRVRIHDNIIEKFFVYFFEGVVRDSAVDLANGTAIKNIPPFKVMKTMPINLPSLGEQHEIVRLLDALLSREQQARDAAEQVLEQIDAMKKAVLARAFRGELGTNVPEERAMEIGG